MSSRLESCSSQSNNSETGHVRRPQALGEFGFGRQIESKEGFRAQRGVA